MQDEIITFSIFTEPKIREKYTELSKERKKELLRQYFLLKWEWIIAQKTDLDNEWYKQLCFIVDECHYYKAISEEEYKKAIGYLQVKLNCQSWQTDTSILPIKIKIFK